MREIINRFDPPDQVICIKAAIIEKDAVEKFDGVMEINLMAPKFSKFIPNQIMGDYEERKHSDKVYLGIFLLVLGALILSFIYWFDQCGRYYMCSNMTLLTFPAFYICLGLSIILGSVCIVRSRNTQRAEARMGVRPIILRGEALAVVEMGGQAMVALAKSKNPQDFQDRMAAKLVTKAGEMVVEKVAEAISGPMMGAVLGGLVGDLSSEDMKEARALAANNLRQEVFKKLKQGLLTAA